MENQSISLDLKHPELQALVGLMDAGVKALGLQSASSAAVLMGKIEAAVADAKENATPVEEK